MSETSPDVDPQEIAPAQLRAMEYFGSKPWRVGVFLGRRVHGLEHHRRLVGQKAIKYNWHLQSNHVLMPTAVIVATGGELGRVEQLQGLTALQVLESDVAHSVLDRARRREPESPISLTNAWFEPFVGSNKIRKWAVWAYFADPPCDDNRLLEGDRQIAQDILGLETDAYPETHRHAALARFVRRAAAEEQFCDVVDGLPLVPLQLGELEFMLTLRFSGARGGPSA